MEIKKINSPLVQREYMNKAEPKAKVATRFVVVFNETEKLYFKLLDSILNLKKCGKINRDENVALLNRLVCQLGLSKEQFLYKKKKDVMRKQNYTDGGFYSGMPEDCKKIEEKLKALREFEKKLSEDYAFVSEGGEGGLAQAAGAAESTHVLRRGSVSSDSAISSMEEDKSDVVFSSDSSVASESGVDSEDEDENVTDSGQLKKRAADHGKENHAVAQPVSKMSINRCDVEKRLNTQYVKVHKLISGLEECWSEKGGYLTGWEEKVNHLFEDFRKTNTSGGGITVLSEQYCSMYWVKMLLIEMWGIVSILCANG